jgi:hypothetical protein
MNKFHSRQVRVKVFSNNRGGIETELNEWLDKNSHTVVNLLQSGEGHSITITLWYRL